MPTSTLVLVKNKTIQKQIQKARMTVIVSLHPIFCDNFTGRYSLWHLQHVLSLAHSLLAIVPKHPYVTDLVASDFSPCFCATDMSKGGQTIPPDIEHIHTHQIVFHQACYIGVWWNIATRGNSTVSNISLEN